VNQAKVCQGHCNGDWRQ